MDRVKAGRLMGRMKEPRSSYVWVLLSNDVIGVRDEGGKERRV